jgi:hypothetical protein
MGKLHASMLAYVTVTCCAMQGCSTPDQVCIRTVHDVEDCTLHARPSVAMVLHLLHATQTLIVLPRGLTLRM